MDALSEMLRVIKLDSAIFFNAEFSEPWCLASRESRAMAPTLTKGGGDLIIFHLLCEGRACTQLEDGEQWRSRLGSSRARVTRRSEGPWRFCTIGTRIRGRSLSWRGKRACRGRCSRSASGTSLGSRQWPT